MITTTQKTPGYATVDEYRQTYPESFGCGKANAHTMSLQGVIANFGAVETYDCGSAHRTNIMSKYGQIITDAPSVLTSSRQSGHSM